MNIPKLTPEEAQHLVESFSLEASKARRPFVRVAAMGYFFRDEEILKYGLDRAKKIES